MTLDVAEGDFIVVTGANGEGKTTFLRLLLKLLKPLSGDVRYYDKGAEVQSLRIGYLPQKKAIDSRFPITVREVLQSGLYENGLFCKKKTYMLQQVDKMLEMLQLQGLGDRLVGDLSGGELQRTLLGRAIISNPQLLVLDEPLSYIDEEFTQDICDMLYRLSQTTTVVLVTHHPHIVEPFATKKIRLVSGVFVTE